MKQLPHKKHFISKLLKNVLAAVIVLTISLVIGIWGYMYFFNLNFIDALYNASMILTGMGPVDKPINDAGKVFASVYAIYSGVAFLTSVAVLFAPIVHRFFHKLKVDVEE
jgi:hypothetical protein